MLHRLAAAHRPDFNMILRGTVRDAPAVMFAVLGLCAFTFWAGLGTPHAGVHTAISLAVAIWVVIYESTAALIALRKRPFTATPAPQVFQTLLIGGMLSACLYAAPALVLAQHSSVAIKLIALLWVLGLQVHISNAWSRLPLFLYTRLVPTLVLLVAVVFRMASTPPGPAQQIDWLIALGAVLLLIFVSLETLKQRVKNDRALNDAEAQALHRDNQLKDAQRIDTVTGTLHRAAFDRALEVMLAEQDPEAGKIGVFLICLKNFSAINETFGYDVGDHVLQTSADRLQQTIDIFGIVGRMSGNEFICAVPDLADRTVVEDLGRDIQSILSRKIPWGDSEIVMQPNVGLSMTQAGAASEIDRHGLAPDTVRSLCAGADQALRRACTLRAEAPVTYEPPRFKALLSSNERKDLIETVVSGQMKPLYKTVRHLETGEICGFTIALRWNTKNGLVLTSREILPYIQEYGVDGQLVSSLLKHIIEDMRLLQAKDADPVPVSLNASAANFLTSKGRQDLSTVLQGNPDLAPYITFNLGDEALSNFGADLAETVMTDLRAAGASFALDDFGRNLLSLHHVQRLRFDTLRISADLAGQEQGRAAVLSGVVSIAQGLDAEVSVGGIETQVQLDRFRDIGCTTGSGPFWGPPLPFEEAIAMLRAQTRPEPA